MGLMFFTPMIDVAKGPAPPSNVSLRARKLLLVVLLEVCIIVTQCYIVLFRSGLE